MIKFEKDNYLIYFKDEEAVIEWLIDNHNSDNPQFDLLDWYDCDFHFWVNDNYTAMDILDYHLTREDLVEDWRDALGSYIRNWWEEFSFVEDK